MAAGRAGFPSAPQPRASLPRLAAPPHGPARRGRDSLVSAGDRERYENPMGSSKNVKNEPVVAEEGYNMMASFQRSNSHDKVRKRVAEEGRTARNLIAWNIPLESKEADGKSKWQSGGKPKRVTQGTHKTAKQNTGLECKLTTAGTGDKTFDKSPTKTRQPRKVDLRARYWAFLFDNLRRAVDEIYVTCESDQSVVECKVCRPTSLAREVKKMSVSRTPRDPKSIHR